MKITDVKVHVLPPSRPLQWKLEWAPRLAPHLFVRVFGEDGNEGQLITWLAGAGEFEDRIQGVKDAIIGRDAHDVEAISYDLTDHLRSPDAVSSTIDICLWDLLGKHHEVPTYKLLGAARERIRAYASTYTYQTVQEYVDLALACREEGYTAFKLHAFGVPEKDIEVCRAVREAVGDTMDLMLDPVNAYDRPGAHRVAKVLEELNFFWFEAPIPDSDILGLQDLTRQYRLPIAGTESVMRGLLYLPPYLTSHAVDQVRVISDIIGGITTTRKAAALAEAFGAKFEPHSYGTTTVQAAHLATMLGMFHCDLFEIPVPTGFLDIGMKDTIRVDKDGYVNAPTKPGLGYDVDMDEIDRLTVRVF